MKKKHAPEQYAAKPKSVAEKPRTQVNEHPALAVAKQLVNWLDRGEVPTSIILLHGLHFARSREDDDLPVDSFRPHLKMQGDDNKVISEIMDSLSRPQIDKTQVIAAWLKLCWVKKVPVKSRISSPQKKPLQAFAKKKGRETFKKRERTCRNTFDKSGQEEIIGWDGYLFCDEWDCGQYWFFLH